MTKQKYIIIILLFFFLSSYIPLISYGDKVEEIIEELDENIEIEDIEYAIDIVYSIIDRNYEEIPIEKRIKLEKILNATKIYLDGYILTEDYKELVSNNLTPKTEEINNTELKNTLKNSIQKIAEISIEYKELNNSARENLEEISENRNTVYAETEEVKISDAPMSQKILLTVNKAIASIIVILLIYFVITIS